MKSMKDTPSRLVVLTTMVAATALLLTGCGQASTTEKSGTTAAVDDKPATGTLTLWAPGGDVDGLKETIKGFEKDNPKVKVTITVIADATTKLGTAIAAGSTPDIAGLYTQQQYPLLRTGAFEPVPAGLVDPATFFPGSYDQGVVDNVALSVPWYAYTYALMYRKDFAEKAGVSAPKTTDDLVSFFKGLQTGGAKKGLGYDVGWNSFVGEDLALWSYSYGAKLMNADQSKWDLNSPEVVKAATLMGSIFTDGVASPDGPGFLDMQPYLVNGNIGSLISGPWVISQLDAAAKTPGWTKDHIGVAAMPAGPAGSFGPVDGGSWGVFKNSKNKDAAWKLIRYLSQPSTQIAQFKAYGSLPAVVSAWKDPAIEGQPLLAPFLTQLKSAKPMPQVTTWLQVTQVMGQQMEPVARGLASPEDAMKAVQAKADSIGTGKG